MVPKKILLVDDNKELLTTFTSILGTEGYHVETATNGEGALEKARATKFHLYILDIKLPDMRGDDLARELRNMNDNVGIILITGYPQLQESIDALEIGIDEILLKPISPEEMIRVAQESTNKTLTYAS
jgi:DNA-binding response OmpR family regulator